MDFDAEELVKHYADLNNEELMRMEASGELTESAYKVLENELNRRGLSIPQRGTDRASPQSLLAHWQGRARLSSAFWFLWVLGNFVFAVTARVVGGLGWTALGVVINLAWMPYLVFAAVAVWGCALNTGWKGWAYLARVIVLVNGFTLLMLIFLSTFQ